MCLEGGEDVLSIMVDLDFFLSWKYYTFLNLTFNINFFIHYFQLNPDSDVLFNKCLLA